jgi:hypothetical protein
MTDITDKRRAQMEAGRKKHRETHAQYNLTYDRTADADVIAVLDRSKGKRSEIVAEALRKTAGWISYGGFLQLNQLEDSKEAYAAYNELYNSIYNHCNEGIKKQYIDGTWHLRFVHSFGE